MTVRSLNFRPNAFTIGYVIEWSPPKHTGLCRFSNSASTACSISGNGSPSVKRKSPASLYAPSAPTSTPSSVHAFDASQVSASRINGGAAEAPRLYDEFASKGMPSNVGAPQGNFLSGLDMGTPQAFLPYTFCGILFAAGAPGFQRPSVPILEGERANNEKPGRDFPGREPELIKAFLLPRQVTQLRMELND